MKHLLICREYPPAPSGGIGTYALHISRLLAEAGETVRVIGQLWEGAENVLEEHCSGKLVVHRIPYQNWKSLLRGRSHPAIPEGISRHLFSTDLPAQCFSWQAALLAETLIAAEGIDLVEAQEYEAPLYYFQLRRALGLGPKLLPPCLVHIHSPSELIAQHNGWKLDSPAITNAKRLERYSIAEADALICPSTYLSRQAEAHFGLSAGTVNTIPYPMGRSAEIERDQHTWEQGTICYMGRLEPRKGVLEWISAAVSVARECPSVRFEFIGANALGSNRISSEDILRRLIPQDLLSNFLLHGEQKHSSLKQYLGMARMAVVPSRWENFPYSCIEAMASGLPVIATRHGGMIEMIRDTCTGWIASDATEAALAEALRRALKTPWTRLAEMGGEAARDICRISDNEKVLAAQMKLRHRLMNQGAGRSPSIPGELSLAGLCLEESIVRLPQGKRRSMRSQEWVKSAAYALRHPVRTAAWFSRQIRSRDTAE